MNKLIDIDGNFISSEISDVFKIPDSNKIKNRMLDGSYQVQSIGDAVDKLNITLNMKETGKTLIDDAYKEDKPLKLYWYDKEYTGVIDEYTALSVFVKGSDNKRVYSAQLTLIVTEEL